MNETQKEGSVLAVHLGVTDRFGNSLIVGGAAARAMALVAPPGVQFIVTGPVVPIQRSRDRGCLPPGH